MNKSVSIIYILITAIASLLVSCADKKPHEDGTFRLICNVAPDLAVDSIYVYQYEDDYNSIRLIDQCKLNSHHSAEVKGVANKPKIGIIKFGQAKYPPEAFFVLESAEIVVRVGNGHISVCGGELNRQYFKLFSDRWKIISDKRAVRKAYERASKNCTLTDSIDAEFLHSNNALNDSLQSLYDKAIMRGDLISDMIWLQFGNDITITPQLSEKLRQGGKSYKFVK